MAREPQVSRQGRYLMHGRGMLIPLVKSRKKGCIFSESSYNPHILCACNFETFFIYTFGRQERTDIFTKCVLCVKIDFCVTE